MKPENVLLGGEAPAAPAADGAERDATRAMRGAKIADFGEAWRHDLAGDRRFTADATPETQARAVADTTPMPMPPPRAPGTVAYWAPELVSPRRFPVAR